MNLIEINDSNISEYKQFEIETDLYNYQSRIYPDKTCDVVLWYYINEDGVNIGSIWLEVNYPSPKGNGLLRA